MTLDRDSRLVRFAYFWPFLGRRPQQTTLCAFFWRTFLIVPVVSAAIAGFICTGLFLLGGVILLHFKEVLIAILVSLIVIGLILSIIRWLDRMEEGRLRRRVEAWERALPEPLSLLARFKQSVFWQGLKAVKGKLCPIIELR